MHRKGQYVSDEGLTFQIYQCQYVTFGGVLVESAGENLTFLLFTNPSSNGWDQCKQPSEQIDRQCGIYYTHSG